MHDVGASRLHTARGGVAFPVRTALGAVPGVEVPAPGKQSGEMLPMVTTLGGGQAVVLLLDEDAACRVPGVAIPHFVLQRWGPACEARNKVLGLKWQRR